MLRKLFFFFESWWYNDKSLNKGNCWSKIQVEKNLGYWDGNDDRKSLYAGGLAGVA